MWINPWKFYKDYKKYLELKSDVEHLVAEDWDHFINNLKIFTFTTASIQFFASFIYLIFLLTTVRLKLPTVKLFCSLIFLYNIVAIYALFYLYDATEDLNIVHEEQSLIGYRRSSVLPN